MGNFFLWLVILLLCLDADTQIAAFVLTGMILTYYILRLFIFNSSYIRKKERKEQEEILKIELEYASQKKQLENKFIEFQKKYEPTRRTVAADIYPLSENAAKDWVVFHMLDVEINKFKYDFFGN